MPRSLRQLVVTSFVLIAAACGPDLPSDLAGAEPRPIGATRDPSPIEKPLSVVSLHVGNLSFDDPSVDLTISINGIVVVDSAFAVAGRGETYDLLMQPGLHPIRIESDSGAVLDDTIAVTAGRARHVRVEHRTGEAGRSAPLLTFTQQAAPFN